MKLMPLLFVAALLAGCATNGDDARLQGTWRSDREASAAQLLRGAMPSWVTNFFGDTTVTYSNRIMTSRYGHEVRPIRYYVAKRGPDYDIVRFSSDNHDIRIRFVDGGRGYWIAWRAPAIKERFDRVTTTPNQVRIGFAKPPTPPAPNEVPREAFFPEGSDAREHGPFTNLVGGRIAALTVTWADPQRFKTERQTKTLMRDILTSTNTQTWTCHIWSFDDVAPVLVARVKHIDGTAGKWVIWGPPPGLYWAYQDGKQQWWWGEWDELNAPYPKSLPTKD